MSITKEVAALQRLPLPQLRARYAEVFGEQTRTGNRIWLVRRIAWRIQALAEGDLSERARRRAAEMASDADFRLSPPRTLAARSESTDAVSTVDLALARDARLPALGTVITRQYKGKTVQVRILSDGFEFENQIFKSLSAIAKVITGTHCNGFLFFRLAGKGAA
jgi:hypothetical protein